MATTYPGALWRPLGQQSQPRMRAHEVICLHTMVGFLRSTDDFFRDNGYGGTESHFGVGGKWGADGPLGLDGAVWQWQDLDFTADANYDGNDRVISIETADNAPARPEQIEPWTPKQLDAIVELVAWLCRRYGIPARLVPDTRPGTKGIGYHAQGTATKLPAGAERWSATIGKPCPTEARIRQVTTVVIPRVDAVLRGAPGSEDELSAAEVKQITDFIDLKVGSAYVALARGEVNGQVDAAHYRQSIAGLDQRVRDGATATDARIDAVEQALRAELAALRAQVQANGGSSAPTVGGDVEVHGTLHLGST